MHCLSFPRSSCCISCRCRPPTGSVCIGCRTVALHLAWPSRCMVCRCLARFLPCLSLSTLAVRARPSHCPLRRRPDAPSLPVIVQPSEPDTISNQTDDDQWRGASRAESCRRRGPGLRCCTHVEPRRGHTRCCSPIGKQFRLQLALSFFPLFLGLGFR